MSVYVGEFLIGTNGPVEYHLAASFADSTKSGWKIGRSTHFDAALSADFLKIIRPRRHQRNTALFLNLQRPLYLCPHGARATSVSWRKHHPSGGLVLQHNSNANMCTARETWSNQGNMSGPSTWGTIFIAFLVLYLQVLACPCCGGAFEGGATDNYPKASWKHFFQKQITSSPMGPIELDDKCQLGSACCLTHYLSADSKRHGLPSLYCDIQPCNSDAIIQKQNLFKSKFHFWNTNECVV